jgi:cell division protein FtsB
MAQDFKAAFGLGNNDKIIGFVDEQGVALAAIQGLNQKLEAQAKQKDAQIADLKQQNAMLEKRLDNLEQAVKTIQQQK